MSRARTTCGIAAFAALLVALGCGGPERRSAGSTGATLTCPEPLHACDVKERSCQEHTFRAMGCLRELSTIGSYPAAKVIDQPLGKPAEPSEADRNVEVALSLAAPGATATLHGVAGSTAGKTILISSLPENDQNVVSLQRVLAHEMTHVFQTEALEADGGAVYTSARGRTTESRFVSALIPEGEATFYETMAASALDGTPFDAEAGRAQEKLDAWLGSLVSPNARALAELRGRIPYEAGFWLFADAWNRGRHAAIVSLVSAAPTSSLVLFGEPAPKLEIPKHTVPSWATSSFEDELGAVATYVNAMRRGVTAPIAKAWRGDRLTTLRRASDADIAIVWTVRFATDADAAAFAEKQPTIPNTTVSYGARGPLAHVTVGDASIQAELQRIALGE